MFYGFARNVFYVQWVYTAVNGMHNRLISILNYLIISEKLKKPNFLRFFIIFLTSRH